MYNFKNKVLSLLKALKTEFVKYIKIHLKVYFHVHSIGI